MNNDIVEQTKLPPSQYLMLETLAARYRLGEMFWTFPSNQSDIARGLEIKNLVQWKHGVAEHTIHVWLTEAGKKYCMLPEINEASSVDKIKSLETHIKELQDLLNSIIELDAELPTSPWAPEDVVWSTSKEKIWTAHWDAAMVKARLINKNI